MARNSIGPRVHIESPLRSAARFRDGDQEADEGEEEEEEEEEEGEDPAALSDTKSARVQRSHQFSDDRRDD